MAILLVEDDERIVTFVKRGLEAEGYLMDVASTGKEALRVGRSPVYGLIILDLMLPDMDGREICRQLRAEEVSTPILMLTAMDALEDKVGGLRLGADDYLTKPFAFEELLARIQALRRRSPSYTSQSIELALADLTLNRETRQVRRGDHVIELTPKEFALLEYLLSAPGRVFSRARILENVWGYSSDPLTNVVDVYMRNLRRKIDEDSDKPLLKTVRGFGYKIDAD
ncbi:MAG: response regulator transcription factor [Pseudomonadota bacterium]